MALVVNRLGKASLLRKPKLCASQKPIEVNADYLAETPPVSRRLLFAKCNVLPAYSMKRVQGGGMHLNNRIPDNQLRPDKLGAVISQLFVRKDGMLKKCLFSYNYSVVYVSVRLKPEVKIVKMKTGNTSGILIYNDGNNFLTFSHYFLQRIQ